MSARASRRPLRGLTSTTTVLAVLALGACGGSDDAGSQSAKGTTVDAAAVATSYADGVLAAYDASIESTTAMQERIEAFVREPTEANLQASREAWVAARDDYGPTEAFRFYNGPIDDADDGPEGQINAWPMDEAYVDYVEGDPDAGIVGDTEGFPGITAQALRAANEEGGETNVSTGWHAIEFLLWGQDTSDEGPGERPVSDYADAETAERRSTYLTVTTRQLLEDLVSVRDEWAMDGGEYRAEFLADPDQALENIIRGIGALTTGELAGERIAVALETGDQEDEHSCFSDNTNADVVNNVRGVRMVYMAEFPGATGPSLNDLLTEANPELAETLRTKIDATLAEAEAFPATFETMIAAQEGTPENEALVGVLTSLEDLGAQLADAAQALGVTVNFEL
jgi:putative iron-regulated protein